MSINSTQFFASPSIFTNMISQLNRQLGPWPLNLTLPDPSELPAATSEKLPNIFTEESSKKCKSVTACPHTARKHYAKNMCNNCYHRKGRDKTAWNCEHTDKRHYAKGKCQFCYLKEYNKVKKSSDLLIETHNS